MSRQDKQRNVSGMRLEVRVRKAKLEDTDRMTDFNVRMADETECKKIDVNIVRQGIISVIDDPSKGFYLVAEKDGDSEIVGQLLVTFEWSDWRNKYFWWIQSVYVDPRFRRKKVFSQLYRTLDGLAISNKDICGFRLYLDKQNESAKKVYKSMGFKKTSYEVYEMEFL